jgi:DNA polymerase V
MPKIFALVDCNNFYVSCERLFRPKLVGRPVVVLSNNDGCIIARSNEVKQLGIAMGAPFFKAKSLIDRHKVEVFSSNYTLYGDLSNRVMNVLQQWEAEVEIYSIDEAFITLPPSGVGGLSEYGQQLKNRIWQHVGIPVSVGIAATKTLAKIANRIAKKNNPHNGVLDLTAPGSIDRALKTVQVEDVWGIGRRYSQKLNEHGIYDALQLKMADDKWIRKHLTISGLRTVWELRGTSCIVSDNSPASRKSIVSSRSFGREVSSAADLREAVASYASVAAQKLRSLKMTASFINVFLATNQFKKNQAQYYKHITVPFPQSSSYTPTIIKSALNGLEKIYKTGYRYKKAGVMLTGISSCQSKQLNLFCSEKKGSDSLMNVLDQINLKWGRDTMQFAAAGMTRPWSMRQSLKSPSYTTNWQELPLVKAL